MQTLTDNMIMRFYLSDGIKVYGPFEQHVVAKFLMDGKISLMTYAKSEVDTDWELVYKHPALVGKDSVITKENTTVAPIQVDNSVQRAFGLMPEEAKPINETDWIGNLESFNHNARSSHSNPLIRLRNNPVSQEGTIGGHHRAVATGQIKRETSRPQKQVLPVEQVWFIKDGESQKGPYNFLKMLDLISTGELKEYDLVRKMGDSDWLNAKGVQEFSENYISRVEGQTVKHLLSKKYFRRNSSRYDFPGSLIAYDGRAISHLEGGDLSSQGCSFFSRPLLYEPNQMLLIRFESPDLAHTHGYHVKAIILRSEKFTMKDKSEHVVHRYSAKFAQTTKDFNDWIKVLAAKAA